MVNFINGHYLSGKKKYIHITVCKQVIKVNFVKENFCQLTKASLFSSAKFYQSYQQQLWLTSCYPVCRFILSQYFVFALAKHKRKACFFFRVCFFIFSVRRVVSEQSALNYSKGYKFVFKCDSNVFIQYVITLHLQLVLTKTNKKVTKNWYRTWILFTLAQLLWEAITTINSSGSLLKTKSSATYMNNDSFAVKTVSKNEKTVG